MSGGTQAKDACRSLGDILLLALLAWAVAASAFAAYNYTRAANLSSELTALRAALTATESELRTLRARVIVVNVAIDYGNGTVRWFNSTALPVGATVHKALLVTAFRVEYTYWTWGVYVTSIDGVAEKILSTNEGYSWLWYIYDREQRKWVLGLVAADQHVLRDGDVILWRYEHWKS